LGWKLCVGKQRRKLKNLRNFVLKNKEEKARTWEFYVGKQRIKVKDFSRVGFPLVREIKRTRYWLVYVEILWRS
jgi:hypothetical protein